MFVLIGIALIFYPKVKDEYYKRQEDEILRNWVKASKQLEINNEILESNKQDITTKKKYIVDINAEGIINIEKIELYEPILKGATEKNLNIGEAWVDGTSEVGQVGNYVIAGHRSRRYGRHFNRLNELEIGDKIEILTKNANYKYIVYDKYIVKSEDVWVLKGNGADSEITLITCDYSIKPTGRLIVKGKIATNTLNE